MRFSSRTPVRLGPSRLHQRLESLPDLIDLTQSNPTRCGIFFPEDSLRRALLSADLASYDPQPLGDPRARAAVADYVSAYSSPCSADQVVLCASTSEAYALLFKILCDPGEAVAAPEPSYPLIEVLAELESVRTLPYRLELDGRQWRIDIESLRETIANGARAVVSIQPNNPTGSCVPSEQIDAVAEICTDHGIPLIADEVFGPYGSDGKRLPSWLNTEGPLRVVLDGLSKAAALPHLKLGWMVLKGPAHQMDELKRRLEWAADAFLSVGGPVQRALPTLLRETTNVQARINARVGYNRAQLAAMLNEVPTVDLLPTQGGWYAVLRVPRVLPEEELVLDLAERAQVLVHPGYFYDFLSEGHLVLSLLPQEDDLARALERMRSWCSAAFD